MRSICPKSYTKRVFDNHSLVSCFAFVTLIPNLLGNSFSLEYVIQLLIHVSGVADLQWENFCYNICITLCIMSLVLIAIGELENQIFFRFTLALGQLLSQNACYSILPCLSQIVLLDFKWIFCMQSSKVWCSPFEFSAFQNIVRYPNP